MAGGRRQHIAPTDGETNAFMREFNVSTIICGDGKTKGVAIKRGQTGHIIRQDSRWGPNLGVVGKRSRQELVPGPDMLGQSKRHGGRAGSIARRHLTEGKT